MRSRGTNEEKEDALVEEMKHPKLKLAKSKQLCNYFSNLTVDFEFENVFTLNPLIMPITNYGELDLT